MSSNKPSTQTQTTTQTRTPWKSEYLNDITARASRLAGDTSNFSPIYSDTTRAGIAGLENAAANGSQANAALGQIVPGSTAGFNTGLGQLQSVASGNYTNNPFTNPVLSQVLSDVKDRVQSAFTAGGRTGSAYDTKTLTRELGNTANNFVLQNYNTERANQDAAAKTLYGGGFTGGQLGTTLDQSSLWAPQVALQAGGLQDQMANAARLAPMQALEWQSGITNPIAQMGGTTSATSTSQTVQPVNKATQYAGYGLMGLGALAAPFTGGASLGLVGTGAGMSFGGGGGGGQVASSSSWNGLGDLFNNGSNYGSYGKPNTSGSQGAGWEVSTPAYWGSQGANRAGSSMPQYWYGSGMGG